MAEKMETCSLCGEESYAHSVSHLKDKTILCHKCATKYGKSYDVKWNFLTKEDLPKLENLPQITDDFHPDFVYEGFKADTKAGLFAMTGHTELFSISGITKYYIEYDLEDISSTHDSSSTYKVKGAKVVIQVKEPVVIQLRQSIRREKESMLEFLDILNVKAKKSYQTKNVALFNFLRKVTGLPQSSSVDLK